LKNMPNLKNSTMERIMKLSISTSILALALGAGLTAQAGLYA